MNYEMFGFSLEIQWAFCLGFFFRWGFEILERIARQWLDRNDQKLKEHEARLITRIANDLRKLDK